MYKVELSIGDITLLDRFGAVLILRSDEEVRGLRAVEGGGYAMVIARATSTGFSYSEYIFDATGLQQGTATLLNIVALLSREDVYGSDLNLDSREGFEILDETAALARNDGPFQVFAVAGGGFAVFATDENGAPAEGAAALPLVNGSGVFWQPPSGQTIVALRQDGAGFRLIVEYDLRGSPAYVEIAVSAGGVVASTGTALTEFRVVVLEAAYRGDINGDGGTGYIKTSVDRLDRGAGDVSVWQISGKAYGVVVILAGGADLIIPIVDSRGNPWSLGSNQQPVAVRELGNGTYTVVVESVGASRNAYSEITISSAGTLVGRATSLTGTRLALAEVAYKTDINNDGIITVPAGATFTLRLDPVANMPLNFSGSHGTIILDGAEFGSGNILTLLGNAPVQVINFSGTLDASGMTAMVKVEADDTTTITAPTATGTLTLTGAGAVTVNALSTSLDASASTGALTVNTVASSTPTITTGSGTTIINSGNNNALVDAALLTDTLEVKGAGVVTGTGLGVNVNAAGFLGALTVTTKDDATLSATTGLGNTTLNSDGSGTITVAGAALASTSTLTLNGSSAYASTDLSGTTVAYTGSGSLALTPKGALSLNLTGSTGAVTVETGAQDGGRLTVTGTPATAPTITGNGAVTVNVGVANTSLAQVSAETDLTVTITAAGTTTLTAAQADRSTITGPTGSFAITDAAAETLYDFGDVAVPITSVTFTSGGRSGHHGLRQCQPADCLG